MGCINTNLLPLKFLLFCFFGGLGCLFPFLALHMREVGLTADEARIVSMVAPCVSILGPLVAGPAVDRLGRHKVLLTGSVLLSAVCYSLLLLVPTVTRLESRQPAVRFRCGAQGASVVQERCMKNCYTWTESQVGPFWLTNCRYDCEDEEEQADAQQQGSGDGSESSLGPFEVDLGGTTVDDEEEPLRPPHLCYKDNEGSTMCHAYTENSSGMGFNASLPQHNTREHECVYPLQRFSVNDRTYSSFTCRTPKSTCIVYCNLRDPYIVGSVLEMSQCQEIIGDPELTFWSYLLVRCIADIFPVASVALLNAMILIMTHENKGDFGHELVWGTLGFAVFAPTIGFLLAEGYTWPPLPLALAFLVFAVLMVVSAILLVAVPVHSEWQAHRLRSYLPRLVHSGEASALLFILLLLGILWGVMDTYLPWYLTDMNGSPFLIGLTLTVGALPAVPFLWNSERVVDYCGHANLLITAFTFYIIRFAGLSFLDDPWWSLVCESLEVFTMSLMWVSAVLYMHHLAPRHLLATGQALATMAHFCLGRCIGAVIGGFVSSWAGPRILYQGAAVVAAVIASLYLLIYHCCMKPRCLPRGHNPDSILEGPVTNGTYTPLRVYHNGRGKTGIRY